MQPNNSKHVTMGSIITANRKYPTAGDMVWWSMQGVAVQHKALETLMTTAGFEDFMPPLPSPRVALRRALKSWIAQRSTGKARANYSGNQWTIVSDDEETREVIVPYPARKNDDWFVFGIIEQQANLALLGMKHTTQIRIKINKTTGIIVVTETDSGDIDAKNESQQLARELDPHYQHYRGLHSGQDISRSIKSIIDKSLWAVSLRYEGGVYFVPTGQDEKLRNIRALVAALPHDPRNRPFFNAVGIMDDQVDTAQLALNAHDAVMAEINALSDDIDKLGKSEGKVRMSTWQDRLMAIQLMNARASAYEELLGMNRTDISKALHALEGSAERLMSKEVEDDTVRVQPVGTV